jgi:NAD(P)-dependent dehydrogenase (short-subunit alcohol dehydrogenase family)
MTTVMITGAGSGLNNGAALGRVRHGVRRIVDRRVAEEPRGGNRRHRRSQVHDFVAPEGPRLIASEALKALGHLDILANCAGGSRPTTWHASDEEWEEGFTLNFDLHRQLTQGLLPHMVERAGCPRAMPAANMPSSTSRLEISANRRTSVPRPHSWHPARRLISPASCSESTEVYDTAPSELQYALYLPLPFRPSAPAPDACRAGHAVMGAFPSRDLI